MHSEPKSVEEVLGLVKPGHQPKSIPEPKSIEGVWRLVQPRHQPTWERKLSKIWRWILDGFLDTLSFSTTKSIPLLVPLNSMAFPSSRIKCEMLCFWSSILAPQNLNGMRGSPFLYLHKRLSLFLSYALVVWSSLLAKCLYIFISTFNCIVINNQNPQKMIAITK